MTGHQHPDPDRTQVIIANHPSYLDDFIVTAAVDIPIHFIVKGELASRLAARMPLESFGVKFVDRFNAREGASDVRRIKEKYSNDQSIVFFPVGTFTSYPGPQPFRMGDFCHRGPQQCARGPGSDQQGASTVVNNDQSLELPRDPALQLRT